MSFDEHYKNMSAIASIERAIRARHDRIPFCLQSAELLPRTDIGLLVQPSICKLEMTRDPTRLLARFGSQMERPETNYMSLNHRKLVRTVLNCLADSRHYSVLYASFGSVHVYTDERKDTLPNASVLCLQNNYNMRGKQALILQFAVREPALPARVRQDSLGLFSAIPNDRPSLLRRSAAAICSNSYSAAKTVTKRVFGRMWSSDSSQHENRQEKNDEAR